MTLFCKNSNFFEVILNILLIFLLNFVSMKILDIHSHKHAPVAKTVICANYAEFQPLEGQIYSVGIHPWNTVEPVSENDIMQLRKAAENPAVAAIGECGYDALKGGPAFRQLNLFKEHVEISESLNLPIIIHDVKGHEIILGVHTEFNPKTRWAIHGFRANCNVAEMFLRKGIYLSFGEKFNQDTLSFVVRNYPELLLAETDESPLSINSIIDSLSQSTDTDLLPIIEKNTSAFLSL